MTRRLQPTVLLCMVAATALPACTMNHMSTKELIDQLDVPNEEVRLEAVWLLASRGPDAVNPLLSALDDDNPRVRGAAAFNLGRIGDRAVVPELRKHLSDSDANVRKAARDALQLLDQNEETLGPSM